MITCRIGSEQAIVHYEGNPGERMPVSGNKGTESPLNTFRLNTGSDMTVLGNVFGIVKTNEVIARYTPEGGTGSYNQ